MVVLNSMDEKLNFSKSATIGFEISGKGDGEHINQCY